MTASRACSRLGRSLFLWVALLAAGCAAPVTPDLVITNARVFTNDLARPWAEAVAIKGDRVVAVGTAAFVTASAAPHTRVIDAGGRVLVPGFNDARVELPLEPPTPAGLSELDRIARSLGITSLQVIAGGPMRSLVAAAQQAKRQARWRLIRSPMEGERPQDEKPFLPPQPGLRLLANGISWTFGSWPGLAAADPARLDTVVEWAYGAEDPLIVAVGGELPDASIDGRAGRAEIQALLHALRRIGVADVWRRKRPRLDLRARIPIDPAAGTAGHPTIHEAVHGALSELGALGIVVTAVPVPWRSRRHMKDTDDFSEPHWFRGAGVVVAVGSGRDRTLVEALADLLEDDSAAREATVAAATWGSAYAEKAERDKGWLGPGTLADLAVLSDDIFTVPVDRLRATTSVLTLVGGTIVYDPGILSVRP